MPPAGSPEHNGVLVDETGGIRRARLDRPECRNAVDRAMLDGLVAALEDPPPVVVLSSTDPAAFCAGMDLNLSSEERTSVSDGLYGLYERMVDSPAVIIVALTGAAVGAGAQLAIAADVRIAHPNAWLRFPGVGHGLAVGAWGLPSLVGRGRALAACTTMDRISADMAATWGLVDALDPDPEAVALSRATGLSGRHAGALARVKHVVGTATAIRAALAEERALNREAWQGSIAGLEPNERQS
jgi:enoyl-CoA hydratase